MTMEINSSYNRYSTNPNISANENQNIHSLTTSEYSNYLSEKYDYFNRQTSIQGVPVSVNVSSAFLKQCAADPEKAKYLEENLAAIPNGVKLLCNYVKMAPGSPVVTYATYMIDNNGNISMMSGSTNDPDGKIARENAEKKTKKKREAQQKAVEKQKKKAEEELKNKKIAKKRKSEEILSKSKRYKLTVSGKDIESIMRSLKLKLQLNSDYISDEQTNNLDIFI